MAVRRAIAARAPATPKQTRLARAKVQHTGLLGANKAGTRKRTAQRGCLVVNAPVTAPDGSSSAPCALSVRPIRPTRRNVEINTPKKINHAQRTKAHQSNQPRRAHQRAQALAVTTKKDPPSPEHRTPPCTSMVATSTTPSQSRWRRLLHETGHRQTRFEQAKWRALESKNKTTATPVLPYGVYSATPSETDLEGGHGWCVCSV